ncbi:anthranilate synthase component 1 [Corynebacterium sp. MSK008]|uniref:anthranilate synthase component 1 n=1 Tax=Corynebacterium sp. MSK008 TaxID=3050188 RepID=UPI00254CFB25|nr:anthranilate synthase component 1 [Corynebacterium sp. MSK008]MDK8878688.1 anthranilate synthase component 1 [Corynebacterium sp. MSK008]
MQYTHREVRYHEDVASLFAHIGGLDADDSVLLESADITTRNGLQSVAVLRASVRVTCTGSRVEVQPLSPSGEVIAANLGLEDYRVGEGVYEFPASHAADERERLTAPSSADVLRALTTRAGYGNEDFPFLAGGFAYDYLDSFEQLPGVADGLNTYPDFQFVLAEVLLRVNHETSTAYLAGVDAAGEGIDLEPLAQRMEEVVPDYAPLAGVAQPLVAKASASDADFRAQVEGLKEHIANGDIYQVVPARAFTAECTDAFGAYRRLRESNPSPYMFYLRGPGYELFGASPESNLKFDHTTRQVELYPIAGTRPRGLNPDGTVNHELDTRMELELRTDAKEVAEHTMLVDLARNDMARVAEPRTRRVRELLQVDRYSRVMHLVSRVTATLASDLDALDAYRACMNMGTLTGAPKLRATELLRGVEGTRRGSYGGAVGYLHGSGDFDTCIVIRSAFVADGVATVQAGAGVVRDSIPQTEADETLHKAYAVLQALAAGRELEVRK